MSATDSVIEINQNTVEEEIPDKIWLLLLGAGTKTDETVQRAVKTLMKFLDVNVDDDDINYENVYNQWLTNFQQDSYKLLLELIDAVQNFYDEQKHDDDSGLPVPKTDVMEHVSVLASGMAVESSDYVDSYRDFTHYLLGNIKNSRILEESAFECVQNTLKTI